MAFILRHHIPCTITVGLPGLSYLAVAVSSGMACVRLDESSLWDGIGGYLNPVSLLLYCPPFGALNGFLAAGLVWRSHKRKVASTGRVRSNRAVTVLSIFTSAGFLYALPVFLFASKWLSQEDLLVERPGGPPRHYPTLLSFSLSEPRLYFLMAVGIGISLFCICCYLVLSHAFAQASMERARVDANRSTAQREDIPVPLPRDYKP